MPCSSEHMSPDRHEKESRRVAELLRWSLTRLGRPVPLWVIQAANDMYGDRDRVHELTAMLCTSCKDLSDDVIYDGRDRKARELANWWDDHKEVDRARSESAAGRKERARLKGQALKKLTAEERAALDL